MAYENNAASSSNNARFEQALGFINFGLPNNDGGTNKLTMAPLKASNAAEKQLFEDLMDENNEAEILEWIKANMVLSFRKNTSGERAINFSYKKAK